MPSQAFQALDGDYGGKGRSGHVSGRALSSTQVVRRPPPGDAATLQSHASDSQPEQGGPRIVLTGGMNRSSTGRLAGYPIEPLSSESSFEEAPPRRRPQPINAELVKLVANYAPLELAQLRALEQKARLRKAQAVAAANSGDVAPVDVETNDGDQPLSGQQSEEIHAARYTAPEAEVANDLVRPSASGVASVARQLGSKAVPKRSSSRSPPRPSHLPAAPAKGAIIRRDLNLMPNPVAQRQTEAVQRQNAVSAFVRRLQREQDVMRAEKERRFKAEQEALAAQLATEAEAAKATAADVSQVPELKAPTIKRRKPATSAASAAGLDSLQVVAAQEPVDKKPVDLRPWRQNMRKKATSLTGEAPAGAPPEVAARPATAAPPPRSVSPGAAAPRMRTLDPVARAQLKEFMDRKAKEVAAKQHQEKLAAEEARKAQLRVNKAEMAKARERAHHYAEAVKERPADYKGPRPAWVDIAPAEGATAARQTLPGRVPSGQQPDMDVVSERAMPHHMSDAMRMEVIERRRLQRLRGGASLAGGGSEVLLPDYGLDEEPQVVRVRDPEALEHNGRVYRAGASRPSRPILATRPASAQPVLNRATQAPTDHAAIALARAARLQPPATARKEGGKQLKDAERRDTSRGRDTSHGRDISRSRQRSPLAGRKHLNSRSRSPSKRMKQQARRSHSGSRAGSAHRRRASKAHSPARDAYATAVQAEVQQARNEQHVGNLWDLALQLSARLGALQQQQGMPQPMEAWPEHRDDLLVPDRPSAQLASLRISTAGTQPHAAVPTGDTEDPSWQDSPMKVDDTLRFDEAVQAEVEFRSDVSWPAASHKKPRLTDSDLGASDSIGSFGGAGGLYGSDKDSADAPSRADVSTFVSMHCSDGAAHGSDGGASANAEGGGGASVVSWEQEGSTRRRKLDTDSEASSRQREEEDTRPRPVRMGVTLLGHAKASSGRASPSRTVPAAPVIQIPLAPSNAQAAVCSIDPSAGLPYENAAFSADEDGSSSGSESVYGQRVLTVAELHSMLEENPQLVQRLSLDRQRDRWEEEADADFAQPGGDKPKVTFLEPRPSEPYSGQYDDDNSSLASSAPDTPSLACEAVIAEYERANSPLRMRPAQRELLKTRASKQAEQQLIEQQQQLADEAEAALDLSTLPLACAEDPMSIINLIAHKGRVHGRPAIIQLSVPPLGFADNQTAAEGPGGMNPVASHGTQAPEAPSGVPVAEVLFVPSADGPDLVFSRTLVQSQRPRQPDMLTSPARVVKDAGVGDGRVDALDYDLSMAQILANDLPPYVLMPASGEARLGNREGGEAHGEVGREPQASTNRYLTDSPPSSSPQPASLQQQVEEQLREARQPKPSGAEVMAELGRLLERRSAVGAEKAASIGAAAVPQHASTHGPYQEATASFSARGMADDTLHSTGGTDTVNVPGVMASPPPRPRAVTFEDEAMLPPERVRLAPTELFRQMQDSVKTFEELDAAERELQQIQQARAIAAVQREAHRIAQKLDQSSAAEAQLQLHLQAQAEMDAKLRHMEESLRNEVRKESLENLHEVASIFVQQLTRNKVAHATVQTLSPPSSPPRRPEIGVQVDPPASTHPVSILRTSSPQPHPSLRSSPPARETNASRRSSSPPYLPQTSLRPPSPSAEHGRSPSRTSSPGPGVGRGYGSRLMVTSGTQSVYSEVFEEDEALHGSPPAGRASRPSLRPASALSVPESMYEGDEFAEDDEDVEEELQARAASRAAHRQASFATSVPDSVSQYHPDRQPSRTSLRHGSTLSIPESVHPGRAASRSVLRQQASVPESIYEEEGEELSASTLPLRNDRLVQRASNVSIAESLVSERPAAVSSHLDAGRRRRSAADSVSYTSAVASDSYKTFPVEESIVRVGGPRSSTSRRRSNAADTVATSEPGYSMEFDDADDVEEELTGVEEESYSGSVQEELPQAPFRAGAKEQRRQTGTTASVQSARSEEREIPSSGEVAQDDSQLFASANSARLLQRHHAEQQRTPPKKSGPNTSTGRTSPNRQEAVTPEQSRNKAKLDDVAAMASPLMLRASMDGGLELDDAMMAAYAADSEARMRQELALLTDRLRALDASAAARMAQLEAQLAAESQPQRHRAVIRAQRLVQVQHDADAADLNRQISAVKADFARQNLMLERLYRLAQITSPGAGAKRDSIWAPPASKAEPAARTRPQTAAVEEATPTSTSRKPAAAAHSGKARNPVSISRATLQHQNSMPESIQEDVLKGGQSGSVGSEVPSEYSEEFEPTSAQPSRRASTSQGRQPKPGRQSSSLMDEIQENLSSRRLNTSGGMSQSVVTEDVPHRSGSTVATGSVRKGHRQHGRSGSIPPSEEKMSSQQQRSSSSVPETEEQDRDQQRSSGSVPATEPQYSEDFEAGPSVSMAKHRHQTRRRSSTTAASEGLGGGASELSVLSADLERQQGELQRMLRRKEKELRDNERRAKLEAKQAAVEALQKQLEALEKRGVTAAAGPASAPRGANPAPSRVLKVARNAPHSDSGVVSEASMQASSQQRGAPTSGNESVTDEIGSGRTASLPDETAGVAASVASESIQSEAASRGRHRSRPSQSHDRRRPSSAGGETESIAYSQGERSASYASSDGGASVSRYRSSGARSAAPSVTSSGTRASHRLTSLQQAVAAKERELRRLQRKAEEEALQRRLEELEAQAMSLKAAPPPAKSTGAKAGTAPATTAGAFSKAVATAARQPLPIASTDPSVYSEEFDNGSATVQSSIPAGGRSSSSVVEEFPTANLRQPYAGRQGAFDRAASQSNSVIDEVPSGIAPREAADSRSRSASTLEEETSQAGLGASRSSGGAASASQRSKGQRGSASVSEEMYNDSFESGSSRGGAVRDASEVLEEMAHSGGNSGGIAGGVTLEPIDEEGMSATQSVVQSSEDVDELQGAEVDYGSDALDSVPASSKGIWTGGGTRDVDEEELGDMAIEYSEQGNAGASSVQDLGGSAVRSSASPTASIVSAGPAPVASPPASASPQPASLASESEYSDPLVLQQGSRPESPAEEYSVDYDMSSDPAAAAGALGAGRSGEIVDDVSGNLGTQRSSVISDGIVSASGLVAAPSSVKLGSTYSEAEEVQASAQALSRSGLKSSTETEEAAESDMGSEAGTDEGPDPAEQLDIEYSPNVLGSEQTYDDDAEVEDDGASADELLVVEERSSISEGMAGDVASEEEYEEDYSETGDRGETLLDITELEAASGSASQRASLSAEVEEETSGRLGTTGASASALQIVSPEVSVAAVNPGQASGAVVEEQVAQRSGVSVLPSASAASIGYSEAGDDYELDFQGSAIEASAVEAIEAEASSRPSIAPQSESSLATGSTASIAEPAVRSMGQDASSLQPQHSLRDVASASSLGARHAAIVSISNLPQQASSASGTMYDEDFEEGEASEAMLAGPGAMERTALSVVEEEGEPVQPTASALYSEDFAATTMGAFAPSFVIAPSAGPASQSAVSASEDNQAEESTADSDLPEDVEVEYGGEGSGEPESEDGAQQYGTSSGAPLGPVLQPTAASVVGIDASQRYGPASNGTSAGYSDDFPEGVATATLAEEDLPAVGSRGSESSADLMQLAQAAAASRDSTALDDEGEPLPSILEQPSSALEDVQSEPEKESSYSADFGATEDAIAASVAAMPALPANMEPSSRSLVAGASGAAASQSSVVDDVAPDAERPSDSADFGAAMCAPSAPAEVQHTLATEFSSRSTAIEALVPASSQTKSVLPSGCLDDVASESGDPSYSADFGATTDLLAASATAPPPAMNCSTGSMAAEAPAAAASLSESVFSVEEEGIAPGIASPESSTTGPLPLEPIPAQPLSDVAVQPPSAASADDDYTQDFGTTDVGALDVEPVLGAAPAGPASHPISQMSSHARSGPGDEDEEADGVAAEDIEEEGDVDEAEGSPGLLPGASVAAGQPAEGEQRSSSGALGAQRSGLAEAGLADPELEESGIISVPRNRGLRQTRQIESRVWRNQQALLGLEEDDGMEAELDLVDVSMTAGEGGGLLEMLGADLIEASEAMTPSHSFRLRSGDLAAASSGSPYALRASLSTRLATLREQYDLEDDGTEASSEALTPSAARAERARVLFLGEQEEQEGEGQSEQQPGSAEASSQRSESEDIAPGMGPELSEPADDISEEEPQDEVESEDDGPFKQPEKQAQGPEGTEAVKQRSNDEDLLPAAPAAPSPVGGTPGPAHPATSQEAGSGESSQGYSDDRLEAPASDEGSRQSVMEYDLYNSVLQQDDSDDLAEVAAAFVSQTRDDDDDDGMGAEASGISASGLSDDLAHFKVTTRLDSDEDEVGIAAPSAAEVAAATATPAVALPATAPSAEPSQEPSEVADEDVEVAEEESAAGHDPFSVDESIDRLPALQPVAAVVSPLHPPAVVTAARPAFPSELPLQSAEHAPLTGVQPKQEAFAPEAKSEPAVEPGTQAQEPAGASSPTVSSPRSSRSGGDLLGETSLGPLPRSGLGDDDEDDGTGLEYRAVYLPQSPRPLANEASADSPVEPSATDAGNQPVLTSLQGPGQTPASEVEEEEPLSAGGLLDQLRAFAGSEDDEEELSGSGMARGISAASLKPAFQALLDEPGDAGDFPKGDFESEIAEMLAASRSRSRLVSPYASRDLAEFSENPTPESLTPYSMSARPSLAGLHPAPHSSDLHAAHAAPAAAAAVAVESPVAVEAAEADSQPLNRDDIVDQITEETAKKLVDDAVIAITSVAGMSAGPSSLTVGDALASAAAPAAISTITSPRSAALALQLQQVPKHRLAQSSTAQFGEDEDVEADAAEPRADRPSSPAAEAAGEDSRVSGASASISMSGDDLDAEIELEEDIEVDGDTGLDLPSPLQSDSGSIGSPRRPPYEPPGASKLSTASTAPALAGEQSTNELQPQASENDSQNNENDKSGLQSDEDLGWGGADEDAELEEGWQPDLSGYIAPEMDQAAIEREHAPAVSTGAPAVAEYVGQVLEYFLEGRPEMLAPGAEPLSLEGFLALERRLADATEAQHIHNKMVYDSVNEALLGIYRAANRIQGQPWARRRQVVKPLPSPAAMAEQVQEQIRKWAAMRMRDPAEIDKVLAADALEDERAWNDLSSEEAEVAREVAELIWDDLMGDTAAVVDALQTQLVAGSAAYSGSSHGRRRMG